METTLTSNETRGLTAISGIVAILFGLAALLWPGMTLTLLVTIFCLFILSYGMLELFAMFRAMRRHTTWWTHLLLGLFSILFSVVIFLWPGMTTFLLLYLIAFWAITVGLMELIVGIVSRKWLMAIIGVITIIFGFVLLANPFGGALGLVMVIGVAAVVRGIMQLVAAFQKPSATSTAG